MTNKDINKRIKCLLSQNKYLRRRIAELEKQWKEANEGCAACREEYKEIIFIERCTRIFQRNKLEKARRQRNYYNRMVQELRHGEKNV